MKLPGFLRRKKDQGPLERKITDLSAMVRALRRDRDSFKAAGRDRLTADWPTAPSSISVRLRNDLRSIRAISRKQAIDNPYARRFLQIVVNNIVGPNGIALQSTVKTPDENEPDQFLNAAVEDAWLEWASEPKNCDVEECLDFFDFQRTIISSVAEDGEVFLRCVSGSGQGPFGFRLQLIEPELVDIKYDVNLDDGVVIRGGIEYDRTGRVLAYHVSQPSRVSAIYGQSFVPVRRLRFPADEMEHIFFAEKVGQLRGIPWMAAALYRLAMLDGYDDAAMIAARIGAAKSFFIQGEQYEGDDVEGDIGVDDPEHLPDVIEIEAGVGEKLPPGTTVEPYDPTYPHEQYASFVERALRGVASGLGVGYEGLANDRSNVTFSSIRAGRMEDIDDWKHKQGWLRRRLHGPVFARFIPLAIMAGKLRIAGSSPLEERVDKIIAGARWITRTWDLVEPLKDTKRAILEINERVRSRSQYIRETYGRDPLEVFREIAEEEDRLEAEGISPIQTASPEARELRDYLDEEGEGT